MFRRCYTYSTMASWCKASGSAASAEIDRSRPKSTEVDNIARKSPKVGRNRQKSSVVNRSQHSFNRNRSTVQGMQTDHRRKHTYWNIKGCGDAARVSTGKFLFFRGKGCGGFCSKCGTNVPPQILPRFSTLRKSKWKEIYGKTQN